MQRRQLLRLAASAALAGSAAARAGDAVVPLITPQEHEAELRAQAAPPADGALPRTRAPYPAIRVIAPLAGASGLASPLRIELVFETSHDAAIVPSTFRVQYGLMKFDLTERLLPHARLSERGFVVERAAVPPGSHRLLLQIADSRGRVTEHQLLLRVS